MTKKQAIRILQLQKETVREFYNDLIWLYQSLSYVEHIFGKDSHEYKLMQSFNVPGARADRVKDGEEETYKRLVKLFNSYIEIVSNKGVQAKPKGNYLSRLNDTWLTTLLTLLASAIFSAGYWVGTFATTNKRIEILEKENEKLKEEALRVFVFPNSDPISNINGDGNCQYVTSHNQS